MKFIKLESFWKEPSAWLVNLNDIKFIEDKGEHRAVTVSINGAAEQILLVKNSLDEIHTAIETSDNNILKDIRKPLYD